MIKKALVVLLSSALLTPMIAKADSTIVFLRHGEKPANNSGQLTCKGLNRALQLPSVLLSQYGKPDAIYAAAPKENKTGSSLRPLTTITPTAIRLSQAIDLNYHAEQTDELADDLLKTQSSGRLTFVSWEHKNLVIAAQKLVKETGGDPTVVPKWPGSDFDSLYIIKLDDQKRFKSFTHGAEGLNNVPDSCAGAS
ncbi:histidine phosphatase family protein [Cedecea neteri]|uniref:ATP/GTP binding motif protein n=1 Tax=Cedecea neteri TaxID=158822 RepID=A0AAN0VT39_9ENTR|nr:MULTISPECIES: histidine phosphatase family protein [Cedecea]AIR60642.1 ATP/GTP binding motif protein [Cedecea neteri]NIG77034.1 histidine phosphatase family protein [Klebsiella sp. Ap-873]WNJ78966.1 histidine phosphatase family protein [Cedecea neteri]SMG59641.1 Broad specificity phosphatase PhoE [Cedecea sp. NFIX57]